MNISKFVTEEKIISQVNILHNPPKIYKQKKEKKLISITIFDLCEKIFIIIGLGFFFFFEKKEIFCNHEVWRNFHGVFTGGRRFG